MVVSCLILNSTLTGSRYASTHLSHSTLTLSRAERVYTPITPSPHHPITPSPHHPTPHHPTPISPPLPTPAAA
ncbi:hypothetical protein [Fischerella sp. NIES-3754]|uniref:hypothetical protein n=1 Tax=Fischerella sp. NIES-3754 TaxID=1752063 RepID=UPI000ADBBD05|nr:hypothetical protein [Fischerella sp. NIES-3754]